MDQVQAIINAAGGLVVAAYQFLLAIGVLGVANWGLVVWVLYWLFLARWPDLRTQLRRGAWVGLVLLYILVAWVWGVCTASQYRFGGVVLPSVAEKFLLAALWLAVAFICGSLQDYFSLTPPAVEIAGPPEGAPADTQGAHGHASHQHDGHAHAASPASGHGHH